MKNSVTQPEHLVASNFFFFFWFELLGQSSDATNGLQSLELQMVELSQAIAQATSHFQNIICCRRIASHSFLQADRSVQSQHHRDHRGVHTWAKITNLSLVPSSCVARRDRVDNELTDVFFPSTASDRDRPQAT